MGNAQTVKDEAYISTYNSLINMGFAERISLKAAHKYPNNIHAAIKFISNAGIIDIPINVECKRNQDYCDNFTLSVPYNDKLNCSFTEIIKHIIEYMHQQCAPIKFFAKQICDDSFIQQELNDTDQDWYQWSHKITDYSKHDVLQKGIHIFIDISKYEHKINLSDITCNSLLLSNEKIQNDTQKFGCLLYAEMYYEYKYDEDHLAHLEKYNHFRNEFAERKQCKFGDECYAFKRLESGQNDISDRCHVKLFRHPPRTREVMTETEMQHNHPFCLNNGWYENEGLYKPTEQDQKEYHYTEEHGYLQALTQEVIDNGFKSDLCLTSEDLKDDDYTILEVVDDRLKSPRHKQMGSPLNRAEMLSIILYTGCDVNYKLCKQQRTGDYTTWKWFDYCLYNAVSKLSQMEHGCYTIYSGLTNTKLPQKYVDSGYFKTYVSTSWDKSVALSFIENNKGMLIEMNEKFRENNICADVSWISKFKDECEVLIARSVDAIFNNFKCRIVDDVDGIQRVELLQFEGHKRATSLIAKMNNMNIEDDIKNKDDESDVIQQKIIMNDINGLEEEHEEKTKDDMKALDDDCDECLILISSEDDNPREFEISRKAALMSNLVKSILEGDANAKKIPIKKVRGDILELVVVYLKHHNGKKPEEIAKPIRSTKMERIVADKWDADYINKMNKKTIFQVILGANYMDLPSLLHLACAKIATLIKGKSPEEIKNILADDSNDNKQEENKDDQ